ncbi:MAG: integrase [archaeon]
MYNSSLFFKNTDEFKQWVSIQNYCQNHLNHIKSYFSRTLDSRQFNTPLELQAYIFSLANGTANSLNTARVYLKYLEQTEKLPLEIITKYRKVLKIVKSRKDFFVPDNEAVLLNYNKIKRNAALELVYLVLATSGIRYGECLKFLKTFQIDKFTINGNIAYYNVSELRNTKNINNIYLPLFVYNKLKTVNNTYNGLRQRYKEKECTFSLKYLRKWHYNFMLYNNVPESVADFIQGRANKSISANHYLSRAQQAAFWYGKIVKELEKVVKS